MKTIASCVEKIILSSPFLEEGLSRQIINFSALAKDLNKPISDMLRKPVKDGAIMMALRRYQQPIHVENSKQLKTVFKISGYKVGVFNRFLMEGPKQKGKKDYFVKNLSSLIFIKQSFSNFLRIIFI